LRSEAEPEIPHMRDLPTREELPPRELAGRTVTGSLFNVGAQAITLVLGFVRSVLLARLLAPEDFGIVALALFFVNLASSIATFGLNAALIQRKTVEPAAISTHFVLRLGLMLVAFVLTLLCIPLFRHFYPDRSLLVPIVVALSAIGLINAVTSTPTVLLKRRLAFRRLALLDVISSATMLGVATLLAWQGWGPWSLVLGEQLAGSLVSAAGVWLYRPPWRLSFRLDRAIVRQYLGFGSFVMANIQLSYLLDQFDDFWTATALGSAAAGFYSKAYEFARYPRRVIAMPLQPVFYSAYARLQADRRRLSRAYYRLNSLVVRFGFLFGLVLVLVAPEFVELLLTDKWLPMVNAFRLMMVYTLLDPLIVTAGNLAVAVGQPQILTRIKLIQLAIFVPSVIMLASLWGIEGVAIAADVMLLIGILFIFRYVRRFVDFSLRRMFGFPVLALALGGAAGLLISSQVHVRGLWLALLVKAAAAGVVYSAVLIIFEHGEYRRNLHTVLGLLWPEGVRIPTLLRRL
jgi:O-antigen/teichoic acid export membrane protein